MAWRGRAVGSECEHPRLRIVLTRTGRVIVTCRACGEWFPHARIASVGDVGHSRRERTSNERDTSPKGGREHPVL